MNKISIENILGKKNRQKITCLTAYSYPIAKLIDPYCDIILVGDSLGMTIYGFDNTREVSLAMMIAHGKAVCKAVKHSFTVVDLPFGSYENSPYQALTSAQEIIEKTNCDAIKIETPANLIPTVKFLCDHKIKVMAHIGLMPQTIENSKDFRYQGRNENDAHEIFNTALELEKAGAFSIVIEAVPEKLATEISRKLTIPTIGIGASGDCDGQVLVIDDLLGLNTEFKPKFVTRYEDLATKISQAVSKFSDDVRNKKFPFPQNLL
jgi:3-methyl-2-oxobutanoate hydroxymethyltransferase